MFNEKIIKVIEDALITVENSCIPNYDRAEKVARALWDSRLVMNSPEMMDEQEPNIYKWTAMENDGYTRMESGAAYNMFDAFIKATEYSPSYHKYIEIKKLDEKEYTDVHRELLDWWKKAK